MNNSNKIVYHLNDKPPFLAWLTFGCQYVATVANYFIFPVILVHLANADIQTATSFISIMMFGTAFATILQSMVKGPLGSGMLLPLSPAPSYFPPSYLAVKLGGLPLLYGMTIIAGIMQALVSPMMKNIKRFVPPELGGLVITLIGFEVGILGLKQFVGSDGIIDQFSHINLLLALIVIFSPLILMIILNLFCKGNLKLFGLLISIIVGYLIVFIFGFFDKNTLQIISQTSWIYWPTISFSHYQFDSTLLIPFAIASLIGSIKVTGSLSALQRYSDENWVRPDMSQIAKGNLADSCGTFFTGILGGMGLNASSSSVALSLSTGVLSRVIAIAYGIIFIILGFCPKVTVILIYMPKTVVASTLIFLGATLVINGLKMVVPYLEQPRRCLIIGISFMLGMSHFVYPHFYQGLPNYVQSFTGSSIALAVVCEITLNFLLMLRLEDNKLCNLLVENSTESYHKVKIFLKELAKDWELQSILIDRAGEIVQVLTSSLKNHVKLLIRYNGNYLILEFEQTEMLSEKVLGKIKNMSDHFTISNEFGLQNIQVYLEH